ncbi:hypothetical protein PVAG01_05977 [Phlyctema vagabunda]|uniref:Protein kinase domain-containing protein n=1 Tax=Phlyctema vagabunda TaxID=108571 RepID=A0ABR4PFP6_9HELO
MEDSIMNSEHSETLLWKSWDDFDHTKTLYLGVQRSTFLVHQADDYAPFILQTCGQYDWTEWRGKMIQLARHNAAFTTPRFMFQHENSIYVGSDVEEFGITLADLIACTIPMLEIHASAVLKQVVQALCKVESLGLVYHDLTASKIFISRAGMVRLAGFGPRLRPQALDAARPNPDNQDVGYLANYILTGLPRILGYSQTLDQKMVVQMKYTKLEVDIDRQFDTAFFDFVDSCMDPICELQRLLRNKFLVVGNQSCLIPLVYNAERTALRAVWRP